MINTVSQKNNLSSEVAVFQCLNLAFSRNKVQNVQNRESYVYLSGYDLKQEASVRKVR